MLGGTCFSLHFSSRNAAPPESRPRQDSRLAERCMFPLLGQN